jgi:hypothetical protein
MSSEGWRFYRQRAAVFGLISLAALGLVGLVPYLIVGYGIDHHGSIAVVVLSVAAVAGMSVHTAWIAPRNGVSETDDGLVSQTPGTWMTFRLKRELVPWEDIDGFVIVPRPAFGVGKFLDLSRRSGPPVRLPVVQGRPMTWKGGDTRDIASVLAERTNEVRRARGLDGEIEVKERP